MNLAEKLNVNPIVHTVTSPKRRSKEDDLYEVYQNIRKEKKGMKANRIYKKELQDLHLHVHTTTTSPTTSSRRISFELESDDTRSDIDTDYPFHNNNNYNNANNYNNLIYCDEAYLYEEEDDDILRRESRRHGGGAQSLYIHDQKQEEIQIQTHEEERKQLESSNNSNTLSTDSNNPSSSNVYHNINNIKKSLLKNTDIGIGTSTSTSTSTGIATGISLFQMEDMEEKTTASSDIDTDKRDPITNKEIFDLIRSIDDPEHPLTLEQLNVVLLNQISVDDEKSKIQVQFTPTIPHCSMATLIGLCIRVKLLRSLPMRFKVKIEVYPGSHASETAVNKQLNDKERVAAALENHHLLKVVNKCIDVDSD